MSQQCRHCGTIDTLLNKCNYCDQNFCSEHLLPENHDCPGLGISETHGPDFRELSPDGTQTTEAEGDTEKADTDTESNRYHETTGESKTLCPNCNQMKHIDGLVCESCAVDEDADEDETVKSEDNEDSNQNASILTTIDNLFWSGRGVIRQSRQYTTGSFWQDLIILTGLLTCVGVGYEAATSGLSSVSTAAQYAALASLITIIGTLAYISAAPVRWAGKSLRKKMLSLVFSFPSTRRRVKRLFQTGVDVAYLTIMIGVMVWLVSSGGLAAIPGIDSIQASDVGVSDGLGDSQQGENVGETSTGAVTTPEKQRSTVDEEEIEQAVHTRVNEIRSQNGLSKLRADQSLFEIADGHSEDMAEDGYFSHASPEGYDFSDRYARAEYRCRVSTGGDTYLTGAENIAYTYAFSNIRRDDGVVVNHDGNETEIGHGIVWQWMHSEGHRENILNPEWKNEGIGVAVSTEDGQRRVIATQNFC